MKYLVPDDLLYTKTHEWLKLEGEHYLFGITDAAQSMLGDIVYLDLKSEGFVTESGKECGIVESVKSASDLYAPISGEIVEVNELNANPQLINQAPYENWIYKIKANDEKLKDEMKNLLNSDQYRDSLV